MFFYLRSCENETNQVKRNDEINMKVELDRSEVCKVLLALTASGQASNNAVFFAIHDKLKKQLAEWDEKHKRI